MELYYESILQIVKDHIPAKQISTLSRLPWMTSQLKRLIKRKQRLYKQAKRFKRPSDWKAYKDMQSQVRSALKQQRIRAKD